ncbi:NAD(P)/FAD-dependent oxidoreductase [Streptomyces sp. HMX87]|uniref:NAD(P)/FAD-dependent oxidoreductase n=1 Tax=Streptomyces sp. HMX87 TaxID=3390849 RepID=UPI003A85FEE4
MTTNMVIYSPEGWYRRHGTHFLVSASRDLTDHVVREQVLKDPRVGVRARTRVVGLLGDRRAVTGVRVRAADGTEADLTADLVVDASGRATRAPRWPARLGITGLAEKRIDSGLVYASRVYRAPSPTRDRPMVGVQADPSLPGPGNSGGLLPIEGDRWHVSLMGAPGGRTATGSFHAATALTDVLAMKAAPASLVRPGVLLTALIGPLRPRPDGPHFTDAERRSLEAVRSGSR